MTRTLALALLALPLALSSALSVARAQGPDVRDVRPIVMLLVDSSGSMERRGDCVCRTPTCEECMPSCGADPQRNRWATVLEALTGTWETFSCAPEDRRNGSYSAQPDFRYYIPHILHPNETRLVGGGVFGAAPQRTDGILDSYLDRVKFGLMTFDGVSTLRDRPLLVTEVEFNTFLASSRGALGGFSYGEPKPFGFLGCGQPYMIDNGAQSDAAGGTLVSVGSDSAGDFTLINQNIQTTLLASRPFGPTPIAGMLEDFEYYLENHPDVARIAAPGGTGDAFQQCRPRYAVLLTDGYPNADMRGDPYNCQAAAPGYPCPYDPPSVTAARLCEYSGASGECEGLTDGIFVVGFAVEDTQAIGELNSIAESGGTCAVPGGDCAYLVGGSADTDELRAAISEILDRAAPGTTTRTVAAFSGTSPGTTQQGQAQFNTGFTLPGGGEPWAGVLERRRFECDASNVPVEQPVEDRDRFHSILNTRATPRRLLTAVPSNAANVGGYLIGNAALPATIGGSGSPSGGGLTGRPAGVGGPSCGGGRVTPPTATPSETGVALTEFATTNSALTWQHLGLASGAERSDVINWVHGDGRANRLGDIYHSSPVVVGPPTEDLPDESFNAFRLRPEVANRPKVVFVGTNDGVMHAFVAEDVTITEGPHAGQTYRAGDELWGFVPPAVYQRLNAARTSHVATVDGTPVVKDVFFNRTPGQTAEAGSYRTVLLFGLRAGGNAYLALDVTDPIEPEFLWQFSHAQMGETYATPSLGQVLVEDASGGIREIAMVVLPGGSGIDRSTGVCGGVGVGSTGCATRGKGRPTNVDGTTTARSNLRCWDARGRALYFLDPGSGEVLTYLDDRAFNAPMTGGVSFFTGDVGTIATRGYVTDADGVIWRLDFSNPEPRNWDADPFHDVFWDGAGGDGQPAYFAPILTTDDQGRVVVIQATGNVDALDSIAYSNRVVSITENLDYGATGELLDVGGTVNWEIRLAQGEQVTGPLELFAGKVYFGSFLSTNDPTNACAFGQSKIWGVEYLLNEVSAAQPTPVPVGGLEEVANSGLFVRHLPPLDNQIVMGVTVTQRPTCSSLAEVSETDPYFGTRRYQQVTSANRGEFFLVAQVSGGGTAAAGGSVAEFSRQLPAPLSFTRVQGLAGTID